VKLNYRPTAEKQTENPLDEEKPLQVDTRGTKLQVKSSEAKKTKAQRSRLKRTQSEKEKDVGRQDARLRRSVQPETPINKKLF